jgi:flagellar biosynthetic protein FliR
LHPIITSAEITTWVGSAMWVLIRIAALVATAPVIGARTVPAKIKLGLSVLITIIILPLIPKAPAVDPLSGSAVLITANQVLIGVAMGLALQLVFSMFVMGGQIIAYQMGLGFSQMVDPQSGTQVPVVSQFYIILLTLIFFSLDGHLAMIKVLTDSFVSLPVGTNGLSKDGIWSLVAWGSDMYAGAVQIALPAIASILLINFTFGVVSRSAPQFNIFSIGFPVTMIMGFFIIMTTLTTILPHIVRQLAAVFGLINQLVSGH